MKGEVSTLANEVETSQKPRVKVADMARRKRHEARSGKYAELKREETQ
jgi:hypothetical protein